MKRRKNPLRSALTGILFPALVLCIVLFFFTALSNLRSGQTDEGREQLEASVRRAAVACYAAEGIYPPDLEYLRSHYGLQIDETRYTVHYDIFADNMMPDITVLENES